MKAIVEFGIPKSALGSKHPCGVDGNITLPSAWQAAKAAAQLAHVLGKRADIPRPQFFYATRAVPRVTWWAADRSCWVAVSLLDGQSRGAYAATVKE